MTGMEPPIYDPDEDPSGAQLDPELVPTFHALNRLAYGSATQEDIARLRTMSGNDEITTSSDRRALVLWNSQGEGTRYTFRRNMTCTFVTEAANQMYDLLGREDQDQNYLRAVRIGRVALGRLLEEREFFKTLAQFNDLLVDDPGDVLQYLSEWGCFPQDFLDNEIQLLVLAGLDPDLAKAMVERAETICATIKDQFEKRPGLMGQIRKLYALFQSLEALIESRQEQGRRATYLQKALQKLVYTLSGIVAIGTNVKLGPVFLEGVQSAISCALGSALIQEAV